ncbi:MAG: fused MFS/spermidine synthase, partial [Xanthobacteraceae bacterium]|nr:fused MFS/spermidine synthase [Xanthobacteraceae bacterium]
FAVQPLFTKMVLPKLGGSPAVWSVAMVFFQATLLAGYAYAHFLTRHLPGRQSVVVHVLVMLSATLALPLAIATGWGRPPIEGEALWLIGLFAVSIGLPFFALSANAPLLQAWFARTGHPSARDPYFLYAASNIGSFLALLSYPFVIEPLTRLGDQTRFWSILFYGLIALIAVCGVLLVRSKNAMPSGTRAGAGRKAAPSARDAAIWMALAAVPSGLMIAVTAHISTDVAAAPLLWVIPLALYLLTFVIVFQTKRVLPHSIFVKLQPFFIAALIAIIVFDLVKYIFVILAVHILTFFVVAMVCHGELARRRPAAQHLTAFYLWMSAGGVIGGIFAGLISPYAFNWVAEYPLLIVLAVLCRPGLAMPGGRYANLFWLAALAVAGLLLVPRIAYGYEFATTAYNGIVLVLLAVSILFSRDTLIFTVIIALTFMFIRIYDSDSKGVTSLRSFFGVNKIFESANGEYRVLMHGTTIHGAQRIRNDKGNPVTGRPEPLTYYHVNSGIGQAIKAVRARKRGPIRIAAVGLGTGSIACLSQAGDMLHYYEIDRTVVRISRDENRFTFLSSCAPNASIILGDARLTLADAPDNRYDIIIVDAFSSDAIPIHLLTREAMEIYLRKIDRRGLVVIHVSNRHLELASVVAGIAQANAAVTRVNRGENDQDVDDDQYKFSATVTAVARTDADFGTLAASPDWAVEAPDPGQRAWTDDYSNIIGALIRNLRE